MIKENLMSWDNKAFRWQKMYKGERFTVRCSDLDLPRHLWTKRDSCESANEWWTNKESELGVIKIHNKYINKSQSGTGYFYVIQLHPIDIPNRVKLGFSMNVGARVRQFAVVAPESKVLKTWQIKFTHEK